VLSFLKRDKTFLLLVTLSTRIPLHHRASRLANPRARPRRCSSGSYSTTKMCWQSSCKEVRQRLSCLATATRPKRNWPPSEMPRAATSPGAGEAGGSPPAPRASLGRALGPPVMMAARRRSGALRSGPAGQKAAMVESCPFVTFALGHSRWPLNCARLRENPWTRAKP